MDISSPPLQIGTQNDTAPHLSSPGIVMSGEPLLTLGDLLTVIDLQVHSKKTTSMLRTTAVRVSEFAGVPLSTLAIEFLADISLPFALYLKDRRYKATTIRTYCHNARVLLGYAIRLGWSSGSQAIIEAWAPIAQALAKFPRATQNIVRFAIRKGKGPADLSGDDIEEWREWMHRRGRRNATVRRQIEIFRRAVTRAKLKHLLPNLSWKLHPTAEKYKVRTCDLPEPLRSEVIALLKWKQDRYSPGRPQKGHHRPISAATLEIWIGRLYGFARDIGHKHDIRTLIELVNEDVVTSFVSWGLNDRNLSSSSLARLKLLYAAMRHYPMYKDLDFQWFATIFSQLPADRESTRLERKAARCLPYDVLAEVPNRMKAFREQRKKLDDQKRAWLFHDELVILWLLTLAWRQRNVRECRIGDPQTSNLFCAELPELVHVARPAWVEQAVSSNPHQPFWQFHFREWETKTGQAVRGILPRRLIAPLEAYLRDHRPHLIRGTDPGTLFLNHKGQPLRAQETSELVSQRVSEHAERRTTPHLFRDALAYKWLEQHPEDYLTVSKILWHRNIATTLQIYGRNFDESNAVRRIDEWLAPQSSQ